MSRIAVMAIVIDGNGLCEVENKDNTEIINRHLTEYGKYIIGRMGIPYRERNLNVISVVLDAPQDIASSLAGRIGKLDGVSVKTLYSKEIFE